MQKQGLVQLTTTTLNPKPESQQESLDGETSKHKPAARPQDPLDPHASKKAAGLQAMPVASTPTKIASGTPRLCSVPFLCAPSVQEP